MNQPKRSVDGFIVRRPQRTYLGAPQRPDVPVRPTRSNSPQQTFPHLGGPSFQQPQQLDRPSVAAMTAREYDKQDIEGTLRALDQQVPSTEGTKGKKHQKARGKRRWVKRGIIALVLIIAIVVGVVLVKLLNASGQILQGNVFGLLQQQPLKKDAYGRSNVLILGTTDDDPHHAGATLTDSMMVLSVHQEKKDAYMFSIPRDLYVKYGRPCASGYAGKINVYFQCSAQGEGREAEQQRMDATRQFIGRLLGLDIQYVVHINTAVIRDAVNAVGGITVNVQSEDPRGVLDASVDWMCRVRGLTAEQRRQRCPTGHYIHFKNGPNEMDGDKAIWFSRARGAFGNSYGLSGSNFDRERNQQLVLVALKEKAMSTGTLTDLGKVTKLMDAMGNNLRTNIDAKEIRTVMDVASKIKEADIHRLDFHQKDAPLMTTGTIPGAGSIVRPVAGLHDYKDIQAYIRSELYATEVSREKAKVAVLNGSGVTGAAQKQADRLTELGIKIVQVGNTPHEWKGKTIVYQVGPEVKKPKTAAKLGELYGSGVKQDAVPFALKVEADFVVIVGE